MDEYVSKGLTQGGISQMEFVQGLCIGYLSNHLYKTQQRNMLFTLVYMSICVSLLFIIREANKHYLKVHIMNKQGYDEFSWPSPMLLGFGFFVFQDSLRNNIKFKYFK